MHSLLELFLRVIVEIFFEPLLRLPGYLILLPFNGGKDPDPDGCLTIFLGVSFWLCVGGMYYWWWG